MTESAPPSPSAPAPHPQSQELTVRYNPLLGVLFIVLGVLNLGIGIAAEAFGNIAIGVVFPLLGLAFCVGTCLIVTPEQAQVKAPIGMTRKRLPIQGLGDLRLDGKKLHRASDNKRIVNLGWGSVRPEDFQALQRAIGA